jgi:ABC-2 type transport system permease protein
VSVILALNARRSWRRVLALAIGFAIFELIVGLSFSSTDQALLRELIDQLPPAVRVLAAGNGADIASPPGYLGSGYFHPVALTLQAAIVISLGAGIARDVEDGVAEMLLSRPLARWRWLSAHATWMAIALAIVSGAGFVGGYSSTFLLDQLSPVRATNLLLASLGGYLVFLSVGALALVVAGLVRTGGRVVGWVAGALLVSYALNYLAQIWELVRPWGRLSILHYYDPASITARGVLPVATIAVLVSVICILTAAAHVLVERRELAP